MILPGKAPEPVERGDVGESGTDCRSCREGPKSLCENLRFSVFANEDSITYAVKNAEKFGYHTHSEALPESDSGFPGGYE